MAALRIDEGEPGEEGVQKFFDLLTRLEGADLKYNCLMDGPPLKAKRAEEQGEEEAEDVEAVVVVEAKRQA
ncbi:hypothetical protein CLOM_g614 [Closterium sp. NIES-68]|nr:hypothetical protein CLOM_g614 [Closterium sp. NIES-68]